MLTIKNTFLEVVSDDEEAGSLRRSSSDSSLAIMHRVCLNETPTVTNPCTPQEPLNWHSDQSLQETMSTRDEHVRIERVSSAIWPSSGSEAEEQSKVNQGKFMNSLLEITGLQSWGSAGHDTGECRPCLWITSVAGCKNGSSCKYCHIRPHRNRMRASKHKRASINRRAAMAVAASGEA
eukprot:gnl/TRDRNA2_/TRDRNA2_172049_c4_seq4.p1 gnl/TRDRNA2_/TRDRNA2_172049_c4~~gnl/TRDRNA2_/TRDRNA2_172049_c4_seq4.p1  ORF type:complete len:179 (-),score=22.95 gnl/TRDRNA2_/TRDRNA2_172049_c4_seq4:97-633(-)